MGVVPSPYSAGFDRVKYGQALTLYNPTILGHPVVVLGHPEVVLGHTGIILGHPGVILGSRVI